MTARGKSTRYDRNYHAPVGYDSPMGKLPSDSMIAATFGGLSFEDDPRATRSERRLRASAPMSGLAGTSTLQLCIEACF